jgi:hypothetical protein
VGFIQSLGPQDEETPASDDAIRNTLEQIGQKLAIENPAVSPAQTAADQSNLKRAAIADPQSFLEAALAPVILSEVRLKFSAADSYQVIGEREAALLQAADRVSVDPALPAELQATTTDNAVLDLLRQKIEDELERMEQEQTAAARATGLPVTAPMGGTIQGIGRRLQEIFDRTKNAPTRAISTAALDRWRDRLHQHAALFFGDVFVYLDERGSFDRPGPIIQDILGAIKGAQRNHPDEPTIVLTHSMGGIIFYDVLTHYDPTLRVSFWASVGSQVGQFEEMKLFRASDKLLREPNKVRVKDWKTRVGYWLNVYDPVDPFSFMVAPVFADVDQDIQYKTGSAVGQAHGAYFKRPSFMRLLLKQLQKALP